jgi:hypothetical protein
VDLLISLAKTHNGNAGGSYINWKNGDCYNTFVLAMPDGTIFFHDKDLPTMWENCYYIFFESILDRFWIPDLPLQLKMIWTLQNWHGKRYYRKKIRPLIQKRFNRSI